MKNELTVRRSIRSMLAYYDFKQSNLAKQIGIKETTFNKAIKEKNYQNVNVEKRIDALNKAMLILIWYDYCEGDNFFYGKLNEMFSNKFRRIIQKHLEGRNI